MDIVAHILSLEVTEDCNLCCSHCLCGEKKKITMSDEVIRGIFSKIKVVETLFLTGGEVFLAYDTIKRVFEIAKEMDVEILNCSLVTNGCIYDERIYALLDEYLDDNYDVFISDDVFHDNSIKRIYKEVNNSLNPDLNPNTLDDVKNNMLKHMNNKHFIDFKSLGNKLINVGRAKNLSGEKHPFEVSGYFYDYYKDNMLLVGPVMFISAEGYITEGNDEIKHYKEGSLGNVLDGSWENFLINGGIHIPCKTATEFFDFLEKRENDYQSLKGEHYIIEDHKMKKIDLKSEEKFEKEFAHFMHFLSSDCKEGITKEKILAYDFSLYPYDLSTMEHYGIK